MSGPGAPSGKRDVARRTWDVEAYAARAKERARAEADAGAERMRARKAAREHVDGDPFAPTRAWLVRREGGVDLDARVGTAEVVASAAASGFFCDVCGVGLKDSNRYLSHVNSKAHQKALGMSMRVRRSTKEEVREAFALAVRRRDARREMEAAGPETLPERLERRRREVAEEKRRAAEQRAEASVGVAEEDMKSAERERLEAAESLGLPASFGSSGK